MERNRSRKKKREMKKDNRKNSSEEDIKDGKTNLEYLKNN